MYPRVFTVKNDSNVPKIQVIANLHLNHIVKYLQEEYALVLTFEFSGAAG